MTQRQRIAQFLLSRGAASPAEVARALGLVPSSVRREMQTLRDKGFAKPERGVYTVTSEGIEDSKRQLPLGGPSGKQGGPVNVVPRTGPAAGPSLAAQILGELEDAIPSANEPGLVELIIKYPRGRYAAEEIAQYVDSQMQGGMSLTALYMIIDAPRSSIRARLADLVRTGRVIKTTEGNYAIPLEPLTVGDLPSTQRRRGYRLYYSKKQGGWRVAIFDPSRRSKPSTVLNPVRIDDSFVVGFSVDAKGYVPVMALETASDYEIEDYDYMPKKLNPRALGFQRTDKGVHVYYKKGDAPRRGDSQYSDISRERGTYNERLYGKGGQPRPPAVALKPEGVEFIRRHNAAQREALRLIRDMQLPSLDSDKAGPERKIRT